MLNAGTLVVVAVLLNLGLAHAVGGFVDGHLNVLVEVSDDDGSQRRVVGVDHLVIDGPESVEVEHLLVPAGSCLHLTIGLVANAMVHVSEVGLGEEIVDGLLKVVGPEAREESTLVVDTLDKGVDGVTVSSDGGNNDLTAVVLDGLGLAHGDCSTLDGLLVDTSSVINSEGDVLDAIAVLGNVSAELGSLLSEGRLKGKANVAVLNNVDASVSVASLEALKKYILMMTWDFQKKYSD